MKSAQADITTILEIVATLKDDVSELKEHHAHAEREHATASVHRIAPGHSPDEPWSPCDRQEVTHYASLAHYH
jgi:hypothetical protein